ncbi:MAG: polysaccharide deacetylase family protein [Candidatus Pacebacteria bacterium]|nr:polysaccharide deacetylase family protein [Candidatus Paceibacterota bacterium]
MKKMIGLFVAAALLAVTPFSAFAADDTLPIPKLRIDAKKRMPMISISFDVADKDNALGASLALLKKYDLPATFFLTTGGVGYDGGLSWQEVQNYISLGYEVASRGHTGADMIKTNMSADAISASIATSTWNIARETGAIATVFSTAWNAGNDVSSSAARALHLAVVSTSDYGAIVGAGQNDLAGIGDGAISRVMLTNATDYGEICDKVAFAASDHRWLNIGIMQVVKDPKASAPEWYDISTANLDLVFECISIYANAGLIKPVTISEGLKAIAPAKVAAK